MDDMSVACRVDLKQHLRHEENSRPRPLKYSERTQQILPESLNSLVPLMKEFEEFTVRNKMKINTTKTKVMKFTRSKTLDFPLEVCFSDGVILEEVESFKLLGVVLNNSLKWQENTDYICSKARKKIWLLRNMKKSGLSESELIDAYKKEIRSLLELAVPVWHSGITVEQSQQIERVQKLSLAAILGSKYTKYSEVLHKMKLDSLSDRRIKICSKFIMKNMESERPFFSSIKKTHDTRSSKNLVKEYKCRTKALYDSSLPFLARLFNKNLQ